MKKFDLMDTFRDNVESEGGCFSLNEMEIEKLYNVVRRMDAYNANIGINPERAEWNPREKAFQEHWLKQNQPLYWINKGHGTLQDLFIEEKDRYNSKVTHVVTEKERQIVATVIQWLGSNCGMCFLEEVFAKFGKRIVDVERLESMVTEHELNKSNREWSDIVDKFKERLTAMNDGLRMIIAISHTRTDKKAKEQILKIATKLLNVKKEDNHATI